MPFVRVWFKSSKSIIKEQNTTQSRCFYFCLALLGASELHGLIDQLLRKLKPLLFQAEHVRKSTKETDLSNQTTHMMSSANSNCPFIKTIEVLITVYSPCLHYGQGSSPSPQLFFSLLFGASWLPHFYLELKIFSLSYSPWSLALLSEEYLSLILTVIWRLRATEMDFRIFLSTGPSS